MVAEVDGRIVGSNFLDQRGPIRGVGPITVAPEGQNSGVGRKLMQAVLERGDGAPGIRLLQDAFHMRSLALYESLGFDVKEGVGVVRGSPRSDPPADMQVRPIGRTISTPVRRCARRSTATNEPTSFGMDPTFAPFVGLREDRLVIASAVSFWPINHGAAESEEALKGLLLGAGAAMRNHSLSSCPCAPASSDGARGGFAPRQADQSDGARGLPRTAGWVVSLGALLNVRDGWSLAPSVRRV